jgi:hypothetical protein
MSLAPIIQSLLDDGGVSYKNNSKSFILNCPKCSKKDKLYIRKVDGAFCCWVCRETEGFAGKAEWALTHLVRMSVEDLRARLYGRGQALAFLELHLDDFFGEDDEIPGWAPEELPEMMPDPGFRDLDTDAGAPGRAYLEGRGLPLALCQAYGIQYWPAKTSVVFPVRQQSRLVGWQTRQIGPTEFQMGNRLIKIPKAITSVGLRKDQTFMFGDRAKSEHLVLCEGPVDALKAHYCGGNVASLGKQVSQTQLEIIKSCGIKRLYLALDPDAFMESQKVLREVSSCVEVYDMRPPSKYKDLGEMPLDEVQQLHYEAPRLSPAHIFLYLKEFYVRG